MISRETSVMLCTLFACVLVVPGIMAYSSGAGDPACDDMIPQHPGSPQTGTSNYAIDISSATYTPGQHITVTISAEAGFTFEGFLAQGRSTGALASNPDHVGSFIVAGATMQTKDCSSPKDSVTHTSNAGKTSQTFTWVAPASDQGPVVIRVTFVRTHAVYWVGQWSRVIVPKPYKSCRKSKPRHYRPMGSDSKSCCPDSTYCCVDHVAFGYRLTENITSTDADVTVKYMTSLAGNVGHAYNKATGVFSAPASGLYNFQVTAYMSATTMMMSDLATACLKHNAATTACVTGTQMGGGPHTSVSQMIPLNLRRGDQVYVSLQPNARMFGMDNLHSSFSGFLVHPDCNED